MLRFTLLAAAAAALLAAPAQAEPTLLMPGVTYERQLQLSRFGPKVLHVVTAPRPGGLYSLAPVLSNGAIVGKEPVTAIQRRLAASATAVGINGDFGTAEGVPSGLLVQGGVLAATPNLRRSAIGIDSTGALHVDRVGLNGTWQGTGQRRALGINRRPTQNGVTLYTPAWGPTTPLEPSGIEAVLPGLGPIAAGRTNGAAVSELRTGGGTPIPPDGAVLVARGSQATRLVEEGKPGTALTIRLLLNPDWSGIVEGLAGGPALVRNGKAIFNPREDFSPSALSVRSARAAVGQRADGRILLVVVDGGLPGFSVGMTNYELAQALARLGAVTGAALEGGAAAAMAFDGKLLSRPTSGERPATEMLGVLYTGVYAAPPEPLLLSPNADGVDERQLFRYRVVRHSTVTVTLVDPAGVSRVIETATRGPGTYQLPWSGRTADGALEPQGAWRWLVTAKDDLGRESVADRPFTLNATLGALAVQPSVVAVGRNGGALTSSFTLAAAATWTATIESASGTVLRTYSGRAATSGRVSFRWDGLYRNRVRAYAGRHQVRVVARNELGTATLLAAFTVRRAGR